MPSGGEHGRVYACLFPSMIKVNKNQFSRKQFENHEGVNKIT